jgi:hypothetical protein
MPSLDARIEQFRFYQTRCNICGTKRTEPGYVHFFTYRDHELQCCDSCSSQAPSPIIRKEYWASAYGVYDEPDAGQPLWRYVDLPKFLDMILFKRLWFPQVKTLEDIFEGALGAKTRHQEWKQWLYDFFVEAVKNHPSKNNGDISISDKYAHEEATRLLSEAETTLAKQKRETYVNCWHIAKHESVLMWKVYANNRPDSVCIKTNLVRVRNCLGQKYRIGIVRYIDFKNTFPDVNFPFLYKRVAFLQETEARIFVRSQYFAPGLDAGPGFYVDIDPEALVDEVLVSPDAPPWLVHNIKRVIELSGVAIRSVRVSDLNEEPF